MPTLDLTPDEAELLKEILTIDLGELRMEIADTDLKSFRQYLKQKEEVIKRLIERLGSP
jgi:hypothetical protein